jgi:hypothetical protein
MNGKRIGRCGIFAAALVMLLSLSLASASGGGSQGGGGTGGGSLGSGGSQGGGGSVQSGGSGLGGNGSGSQEGGLGDTLRTRDRDQPRDQTQDPDQDQTRDQLRTRDRIHDPDLVYRDSGGKECEWQEKFNHRLQKYADNDDPEGLTRSLYRIANRYRLSSEEDGEGFVKWALQHRPWAFEE